MLPAPVIHTPQLVDRALEFAASNGDENPRTLKVVSGRYDKTVRMVMDARIGLGSRQPRATTARRAQPHHGHRRHYRDPRHADSRLAHPDGGAERREVPLHGRARHLPADRRRVHEDGARHPREGDRGLRL